MSIEASSYNLQIEDEQEPVIHVPYREYLKTRTAEVGTVIDDVKPADLFTFQRWLDDTKIANVLDYASTGNPRLDYITGFLHHHTKFDKNVIVIGNGNHRGLYALIKRRKLSVEIREPNEEYDENPFRISNLLKKYGNPFANL